jgi:hypothetical protein
MRGQLFSATAGLMLVAGLIFSGNLASAQDLAPTLPPQNRIQDLLHSGDPQSVAWGAHYALASKDQALFSDLASLADDWQSLPHSTTDERPAPLSSDQLDQRDAVAAVLDALIQLHAPLPADTLRRLAPDFPNDVAIFLSRMPLAESQSLSFDLYRSEIKNEHSLRYVSAALQAQNPLPGFAADLFSGIRVRATIFVVAPGAGPFGTGGGGHDCGVFSSAEARRQWPAFGVYGFSHEKSKDSFRVVTGIHPVYAKRTQTTRYQADSCAFMVSLGPDQRRSLLAQMLNVSPDTISWKTETVENIEFKSEAQFSTDLLRFISTQQDELRATAADLVSKGLITPAGLEDSLPQLDLHVNDMRGAGYSPLAQLSSLPPHVTWSDSPWR